jgi:membrane protein required for colicin V production
MWLDILFLIVAGYAFYRGYNAGIIRTVLMVISVLVALILSMRYAGHTTTLLQDVFRSENPLIFLPGFLLTFVLVIALIRWLAGLLEKGLGAIKLNILNRGVGGLLYATGATIALSTLLGLVDRTDIIPATSKDHSMTWPLLMTVPDQAARAYADLRPVFDDFLDDTREVLERTHDGERQ